MLNKIKAHVVFNVLLKRPNIEKAYAMVGKEDSWYDTISTVHKSLEEIKKLNHEVLEINSHDNLVLKGIYYPTSTKENITVICVHGYTSHAEREWAFPGLFYHSLGYNVFIPYLRAHGLSEGKYITFGALEYLDIIKWIEYINKINPNTKIIIHGLSMGGGIALDLANKEMNNVKCLISDAPSTSIEWFFKGVCQNTFKKNAEKIALETIKLFNKKFKVNASEFDSFKIVKESKYPILLAAGSNEGRKEDFDNLKKLNPHKTSIVILEGCNHGNGMYKQTEVFQKAIKDFINENIK